MGDPPFLLGYAVSDAAVGVVRYVTEDLVQTAVKAGVLSRPTGLATGFSGELYIADTTAGKIYALSNTGVLTELLSGLSEPTGLYFLDGTLYIAETGRNRIVKADLTAETVTPLAPRALCRMGDTLYAADTFASSLITVDLTPKSFRDVAADSWYASPSRWAADNNIVQGFEDGTFRGDTPITREQFVTILYRYASSIGLDTAKTRRYRLVR